jgi:hypothetical protein
MYLLINLHISIHFGVKTVGGWGCMDTSDLVHNHAKLAAKAEMFPCHHEQYLLYIGFPLMDISLDSFPHAASCHGGFE